MNKFKELKTLEFYRCNYNIEKIIFPILNLEILYLGDFYELISLDLNNLYKLKVLSLIDLINLEKLNINELENLEELYVDGLNKLEILTFDKIKLNILSFGDMNSLKYIDGYFKDHDLEMRHQPNNYYKQRIVCRRRIYLLSDFGSENICGKCERNVSVHNKINIRNSKIEFEQLLEDEEILHNIKILTCC